MKIPKSERLSIRKRFSKVLTHIFGRQDVNCAKVPISQCRHYCAFKYGSESFNPYENYIIGLHKGVPIVELRRTFEDFLMYYRPHNFGEVFGIELSRQVPLWVYPWQHDQNFNLKKGWPINLNEVPDIITHFCEQGIKRSRIEEEYFWLERAYTTILRHGYQPSDNSFIEAFELNTENESVFILTDGNHRVSALTALGHKEVMIKVTRSIRWNSETHKKWPQVRLGIYSEQDARKLLKVYFVGIDGFNRANRPAKILEE
jgi:hypothetical protein